MTALVVTYSPLEHQAIVGLCFSQSIGIPSKASHQINTAFRALSFVAMFVSNVVMIKIFLRSMEILGSFKATVINSTANLIAVVSALR